MNIGYGFSNGFPGRYDFGGYSSGQLKYTSYSYAKNENADITIVTDDGDRVTISSYTSEQSSYTSYNGLLRSGTSSAEAEGYEFQNRIHRDFSISIAGDLDSEEYDDIVSALETIDSAMESISSENMADLQSIADKFGGLESLSGLSASIKVEEATYYEQASLISEGNKPEERDSKNIGPVQDLYAALDKILNSAQNHGKAYGKVKQLISEYLSGLLGTLSEKSGENGYNSEAGEMLRDIIMNRFTEKSVEEENIAPNIPVESCRQ